MRRSARLHPYDEDREKGRFKKKCQVKNHVDFSEDSSKILCLKTSKRITHKQRENLIDNGVIDDETRNICKHCFETNQPTTSLNTQNASNPTDKDSEVDNEFNFFEIGKYLQSLIQLDTKKLFKNKTKNIGSLLEYNVCDWVLDRPHELLLLIGTMCGVDMNTASESKINIISKIIELIYYCNNSRLVLPNHFLENLLSYTFTNSRTYTNFLANRSPGGSYSYITSWLNTQANDPIQFPEGLVKAVFDNNQTIG